MQAAEFVAAALGGEGRPAPSVPWLDELRVAALVHFRQRGFPSPKEEEWRGTSLDSVASTPFRLYEPGEIDVAGRDLEPWNGGPIAASLVLVNGRLDPALSHHRTLPSSVEVGSLASAIGRRTDWIEPLFARLARVEDNPFVALNTGVFEDGAAIRIPRGVTVSTPIVIRHCALPGEQPVMASPRILIALEAGAQATIIESFEGSGDQRSMTNVVAEVHLAQGANLDLVRIQRETEHNVHISTSAVRLGRDARLRSQSVVLRGGTTRSALGVSLAGSGAEADLSGLYVPRGRQHVDLRTTVDHAVPNTSSRQLYKGVLDERARGMFTGKVIVRAGAQKTDARQMNQNLLLSGEASADSKPQLEIYADDVACKHGSTTGRLREEALFYMRSRGVGEREARSILSFAFAREVLDRMSEPSSRALVANELGRRWPGSHELMEG